MEFCCYRSRVPDGKQLEHTLKWTVYFRKRGGFETESGLSQMNPCLDHTYRGVDEKNALPYLVTQVTIYVLYLKSSSFLMELNPIDHILSSKKLARSNVLRTNPHFF